MTSEADPSASAPRRWARLFAFALAATAAIAAVLILKDYAWMIPRSFQRRAAGWFLEALLVAHGLVLVAVPIGGALLTLLLLRARRRRQHRPALARGLLLCVSCLFGLVLVETSAAAWTAWAHRIPKLPEPAPKVPKPLPTLPGEAEKTTPRANDEIEIVVIGESSAKGEPYGDPQPPYTSWLSIGQIVAWQLERAIPERRFHLNILAIGGATLEAQHQRLAELKRPPDVLIVYSGHNEFHSRFNWQRIVPPGPPSPSTSQAGSGPRFELSTPLARMIREAIARNGVEVAPPPQVTRQLVDWPVCTPAERAEVLADFERRLEAITGYCERISALPILVIPPGNDAGYEPNRSVVPGALTTDQVDAITREFKAARAIEDSDPARSLVLYRAFLSRLPGFSEAHYRVGKLLERAGDDEAAYREYALARDLDGFPQRCPTDFQDAYRTVASRHPGALLIDGQAVMRALSPHGLLDDHLFHDGQHPVLTGHVALAQAVLDAVHSRHALGWPEKTPPVRIDPAECAEHFGMTPNRWAVVCGRVVFFYKRTAYLRHDPRHRLEIVEQYAKAAREIRAGTAPEATGVPGLGVRPMR